LSLIPVTLNNATDTWVNQTRSTTNYADGTLLRVSAASGAAQYSYIYFARPFPLGATITTATLHLRQASGTLAGSRTVTLRRALASWSVSQLTYANQPATDTVAPVLLGRTTPVLNQDWPFNITSMMQLVADGAPWYGIRIETNDALGHAWWSAQAATLKPTLDVTWTDAPEAPSTLSPSGNRSISVSKPILRFDFTDHVGNTALQAAQVQTNATNVWTAPTFDSDTVLTSTPQVDLNASFPVSFPAVGTTNTSTNVTTTTPLFDTADIGATITGTGIPAGATLTAVAGNGLSATLSAAATVTGTTAATVTETFPAMSSGGSTYWRVRVQDGAGVWSPWSLGAQFSRTTKGTLTITNPAVSPNNFVTEATPPITWTFTGRTQTAHQVLLFDNNGKALWTSGKITTTATAYTLPPGLIHDVTTYSIMVRVWDTISREATPGDQAWTEASQSFTYNLSATVATVTGLSSTDLTPAPAAQLDFSRSTAPDSFTIVRDGKVIASNLLPGDLFVSGTAYRYTDYAANPQVSHTWSVRAVVNGVTSSANPTTTKTLKPTGIWLIDPVTNTQVMLTGSDSGSWTNGEDAAIYTPVGGTKVVRVTQSLRGFEGNITGQLLTYGTTTVQAATAAMYSLKENAGATYSLTFQDFTIPVVIGNVVIAPIRGPEVRKQVSFDFWQVGNLPFDATL
jgi:hypothetical protein